MFDEKAFRKAVKIVEGKMSRGEYEDYDHGCGARCVVGKAFEEMFGRQAVDSNEVVNAFGSSHTWPGAMNSLWSSAGMYITTDQKQGAEKARTYLEATKQLEDA